MMEFFSWVSKVSALRMPMAQNNSCMTNVETRYYQDQQLDGQRDKAWIQGDDDECLVSQESLGKMNMHMNFSSLIKS